MPEFLSFQELIIEAADDLACHVAFAPTDDAEIADTVIVALTLQDKAVDDQKFRHHYIARDADLDTFRLVKSTTVSTDGKLTVTRAFPTGEVDTGEALHLFKVLDPTEWSLAANNGLRDKYLKSRFYIPFAEEQDEYNLTAQAPWLRSSEQILRIRRRDERDNRITEAEMPVRYVYDNEANVSLIIPKVDAAEGMGLEIEARRYYEKVTAFGTTVRMTHDRLIRAAIKHEALKLIFTTLGQQARAYWGQQMLLTERDLVEQEAKFQSVSVKRDWATEEVRSTGDRQALAGWRW